MLIRDLIRKPTRALKHLLLCVKKQLSASVAADPQGREKFNARLQKYFPCLFNLHVGLYGSRVLMSVRARSGSVNG